MRCVQEVVRPDEKQALFDEYISSSHDDTANINETIIFRASMSSSWDEGVGFTWQEAEADAIEAFKDAAKDRGYTLGLVQIGWGAPFCVGRVEKPKEQEQTPKSSRQLCFLDNFGTIGDKPEKASKTKAPTLNGKDL